MPIINNSLPTWMPDRAFNKESTNLIIDLFFSAATYVLFKTFIRMLAAKTASFDSIAKPSTWAFYPPALATRNFSRPKPSTRRMSLCRTLGVLVQNVSSHRNKLVKWNVGVQDFDVKRNQHLIFIQDNLTQTFLDR